MDTNKPSRRSPLRFFALLFALSVPFWMIGAVAKQGLPAPIGLPLSSLQLVCPLLAALILVYMESGPGGVKRLLGRVLNYRSIKPKIWYLPALLMMPLIYSLSYGVMRLFGRPLPEPHVSLVAIPLLFIVFFVTATAEEVGWSGYVTDTMQHRWGALGAGILIGLVWAFWHLVPDIQANRAPSWIVWHRFTTVAQRILIVWLYNNTGRSLFAAILFHDMDNVAVFSFPNGGSHYDPGISGPITATAAAIVTFLWGRKTLSRFRYRVRG